MFSLSVGVDIIERGVFVVTKFTPIPYVSTLKQVMDSESTEGYYPFMRFAKVNQSGGLLEMKVVPFARFREVPFSPSLVEIRSCDCGGDICGIPTVILLFTKAQLAEYYYLDGDSTVMTFVTREA